MSDYLNSVDANRFEGKNDDLPIAMEGVIFRVVKLENRLRIMVEVQENTTHEQLRNAIPLAIEWRNRLLDFQGPSLAGVNGFLEILLLRHENGKSYSMLAEQVNQKVEELLEEYSKVLSAYELAKYNFRTMGDFFDWQSKLENNPSSLSHVILLLKAFKMNQDEIDEILANGLRRIQEGEKPFEKGYPVSRARIIETLRSWKRGKKHQILVELEGVGKT